MTRLIEFILSLFRGKSKMPKIKELVTIKDIITSSGRYPERAQSLELSMQVRDNMRSLAAKINGLLHDLKWIEEIEFSSGFRPSSVNRKISNAAKRSAHMDGKAGDILDDKEQTLGKKIAENPRLLKKHGLMMEDLAATKGKYTNWVHLDTKKRRYRASQTFRP